MSTTLRSGVPAAPPPRLGGLRPRYDGTEACSHPDPLEQAGFDAVAGSDSQAAKTLCRRCPFLTGCRDFALHHDVTGVWGGADDADRRRVRAARGLPDPGPISDELDALVRSWRQPTAEPSTLREAS